MNPTNNINARIFIFFLFITTSILPFHINAQDFAKKTKWGGRLMIDAVHYKYGDIKQSGLEIRRARFFSKGHVAENLSYKLQIDFAGGKPAFKDVYIRCNQVPYIGGTLTFGNQTDPLSLEQNTSSKYITFMERALPSALFHKRSAGIGYSNQGLLYGKLGFQATFLYSLGSTIKAIDLSPYARIATVKLSAIPLKTKDHVFYAGLGYSTRTIDNSIGFKIHPESHLTPTVISTTLEKVSKYDLFNIDFAWVIHALSVQGEYLSGKYKNETGTFNGSSWYAMVSYFLTGERRNFKNGASGFSRIHPKHNFEPAKGHWGAWEFALRYSNMDLSSINAAANINDLSAGINLYLNPYARMMYNFILDMDGTDNDRSIHQMRFQLDF